LCQEPAVVPLCQESAVSHCTESLLVIGMPHGVRSQWCQNILLC